MSLPAFPTDVGGFSGITGTDGPSASALESLRASFATEFAQTTDDDQDPSPTSAATSDRTSSSKTTTTASASATPTVPTTLATSIIPSSDATSPSATNSQPSTSTGENAASNTTAEAPTVSEKDSCNSISCNSGLQAAVAVPVVIAVLLIVAVLFLRRRRRRQEAQPVSEKQQPVKKKKFSRHLRIFSFDAELLMGGWRSSSNSIRSRQTGSFRSGQSSGHGQSPSLHSIDEVAPPYRDAMSTAQRPIATTGVARVTASLPDPFPRPSSTATAPPPYAAAPGNTSRQSNRSARDPFADATPISPIEGSPFNDPPEDGFSPTSPSDPMMSRQSSLLRSINDDGGSTLAGSDAGSIREAQIGRSLSVMSGGRTIDNTRRANSG
jgi:hypothetical protein